MCEALGVNRSSFYYQCVEKDHTSETSLEEKVAEIFRQSRETYGAKRIKVVLDHEGNVASRRKTSRIMKVKGLISLYTKKSYKPQQNMVNNEKIENIVNREYDDKKPREVIVSDLTYVRVLSKWYYICVITDLYNREIVGYSCGRNKDAALVLRAFEKIDDPLDSFELFHTDRGSEFKNISLDALLMQNNIQRSLSRKGNPYDNAVAEATFKTIKTEFASEIFESLSQLQLQLTDCIHWYNNHRLHSALGYQTPIEYAKQTTL